MKKSLIAIGLSLSMMLAMATPVFAANTNPNVNTDGTEVTLPGDPSYTAGGKTQTAGQSYNEATIENKDGTTWKTVNDDDTVAQATDTTADINVWAMVTDSAAKIYKVDLTWGAMKFEYTDTNGQWDPAAHTYTATGKPAEWTAIYLDGTNNKVGITNHSNNAINAGFAYAMSGTAFNDVATSNDAVIGNFFADIAKAKAAALVLKGTYTGGAVVDATVKDKLAGSKIALPTADAYNSSATTPTTVTDNKTAGARAGEVLFAFSGAPDKGKGKDLNTFKKVGVITVTVTPNNEESLNRAPFVAVP